MDTNTITLIVALGIIAIIAIALFRNKNGKVTTKIKHGKSEFTLEADGAESTDKKTNQIIIKGGKENKVEQDINIESRDNKDNKINLEDTDNSQIEQDKLNL